MRLNHENPLNQGYEKKRVQYIEISFLFYDSMVQFGRNFLFFPGLLFSRFLGGRIEVNTPKLHTNEQHS